MISRQRGFTLTELVMVIVIVGILSIALTRFITATVGGYVDTASRQQLASAGYIASEKISRELRMALPNSIRLNATDSCIEYIPILAGTHYVSIPLETAGDSISAVGARVSAAVSGRAVVYPVSTSSVYSPSSSGAITAATATLPVGTDEIAISLSSNHQFDADSPARRIFIVDSPRAFCVVGGLMFQYRNYGFNNAVTLPPTGGQRAVLLDNISSSANTFDYTPASLVRNSVVNFRYTLNKNDETWQTEQEVHIRNVP